MHTGIQQWIAYHTLCLLHGEKKRSPFAQWKKKKSYANVYVTEKSVGFGRSAETEYADALKESEWRKQFKWVQI